MIKKLIKNLCAAIISCLALLIVSLIIWYFMKESQTTLQDILFCVGAVPIVLFSIGVFGDFYGRGDVSYQLSRSVSSQSSNQRAIQDKSYTESRLKSGLNWIIAGLLLWIVCYFI